MDIHIQGRELSVTGNFFILSGMNEQDIEKRIKALDKRRGANLRRLRTRKGWSQEQLFEKTGIGQTKISAYENGLGFDKETLVRLCEAFKVKEWEFDWEESVPIVKDEREQYALDLFRQANALGVAEDIEKYETFRIEEAKKEDSTGGEKSDQKTISEHPARRAQRAVEIMTQHRKRKKESA